jgi:hypothetical protein
MTATIVLVVTSWLLELEDNPLVRRAQLARTQTRTADPRRRHLAKSAPPDSSIETLDRVAKPPAKNAPQDSRRCLEPHINPSALLNVSLARGLRPALLLALHAQQGLTIPTRALRASPSAPLALLASIRVPVDKSPVRHALLELGAAASVPSTPLPASRALPEPTIQTGDPPFRMNAVNARTICPHRPNLRNRKTASPFAAPDLGLPLDDRHALPVLLERLIPTPDPPPHLHACHAVQERLLMKVKPFAPSALLASSGPS